MKRLLYVLGALVLVGAVVAVVVRQRPEAASPPPLKNFAIKYADGSPLWSSDSTTPEPPLVTQVLTELSRQASLDRDQLRRVGGTVVTTIDPKAQVAATSAVDATARAQAPALRYSLTAVDPATGGVRAYVPGSEGTRDGDPDPTDYAGGVLKQPGTTFFPLNVVAGMKEGKQLDSVFDGTKRRVAGVEVWDGGRCGKSCTVREALAKSSGVVMFDLVANSTGSRAVQAAARQAGVPESVVVEGKETKLLVGEKGNPPDTDIALGADPASLRPLDLTTVYATFAAGGVQHRTHFVTKVTDDNSRPLYQVVESTTPAFDPDIAVSAEVSSRITGVLKENTACPGAVCRTAYYQQDATGQRSHAWATGYTDRMAITVLVTTQNRAQHVPLDVKQTIEQAVLPKTVWEAFAAQA
ncbi:penicillin-binding transpeptidase domain-containing protein [Lentzea californiensis]|uniref:penicillin-binding transpeptidase domain-containing protein n=1 Tax=Lentzea californiensis TaxID=438851 RepID=UPI00216481C2|nr:penicillin-binding transpeptidase domain-containing protein [Lentzea californiensis]MCR3747651.1 Penicillin binding protein transpeptidase domain-containing protein [Lentzea californiensis]